MSQRPGFPALPFAILLCALAPLGAAEPAAPEAAAPAAAPRSRMGKTGIR